MEMIIYEVEIFNSRARMFGMESSRRRYFSTREKAEKYVENFHKEEKDLDMRTRINEIEVE